MPTSTGSGSTSATVSNAEFQAIFTWLNNLIFATGACVQTADTGQVNPATATFPGANNTSGGYLIGRFNDSKQSTAPIFFKFELARGASAAVVSIWLTIGKGSNGSGTITNQILAATAFAMTGTNAAYNWQGCAMPDGFWLQLSTATTFAASGNNVLIFERCATGGSGEFEDDCLLFHTPSGGVDVASTMLYCDYANTTTYSRSVTVASTNFSGFNNYVMDYTSLSGVYPGSGKPSIYPFYSWKRQGEIGGPFRSMALCFDRDFTDSTTYDNLEIGGHVMSMRKIASQRMGLLGGNISGTPDIMLVNQRFLVRWE
jgi:hypothetical protein